MGPALVRAVLLVLAHVPQGLAIGVAEDLGECTQRVAHARYCLFYVFLYLCDCFVVISIDFARLAQDVVQCARQTGAKYPRPRTVRGSRSPSHRCRHRLIGTIDSPIVFSTGLLSLLACFDIWGGVSCSRALSPRFDLSVPLLHVEWQVSKCAC